MVTSNKSSASEELVAIFDVNINISSISFADSFEVEAYDQVSDGCWTSAASAESSIKRELIDSGYNNIVEKKNEYGKWQVILNALGYEVSPGMCAVYVEFFVRGSNVDRVYIEDIEVISLNRVNHYTRSGLFSGPRATMSGRINESFRESFNDFIVRVNSEKKSLRSQVDTRDISTENKSIVIQKLAP